MVNHPLMDVVDDEVAVAVQRQVDTLVIGGLSAEVSTPVPTGYSRHDYQCPSCGCLLVNVALPFGKTEVQRCPSCGSEMTAYFGATRDVLINFGERSTHDDITKFQFQNLS